MSPDGRFVITTADGVGKVRDLDQHTVSPPSTSATPIRAILDMGFLSDGEIALAFQNGAGALPPGVRPAHRRQSGASRSAKLGGALQRRQRQLSHRPATESKRAVARRRAGRRVSPWSAARLALPNPNSLLMVRGGAAHHRDRRRGGPCWELPRVVEPCSHRRQAPFYCREIEFDATGEPVSSAGAVRWTIDPARPSHRPASRSGSSSPESTALSPDGKLLAVGTDAEMVRLIDVETGKDVRKPLPMAAMIVHDIHFSPDGSWLARPCARVKPERR